MYDRNATAASLQKALELWRQRGTPPEEMAFRLKMSYTSVINWMKGRRLPKYPTIRQIENLSGIKIL